MIDNALNKNAQRSKKMIKKAFVELLQTEDFKKITVTKLANKAEINRGTFYAHYLDTKQVIAEISNEIMEQIGLIIKGIKNINLLDNPLPTLLKINKFLKKDLEYYKLLASVKESSEFIEKLVEIFVNKILSDSQLQNIINDYEQFMVIVSFTANGLASFYIDYLRGKTTADIDKTAVLISKIIQNNFKTFIHTF